MHKNLPQMQFMTFVYHDLELKHHGFSENLYENIQNTKKNLWKTIDISANYIIPDNSEFSC